MQKDFGNAVPDKKSKAVYTLIEKKEGLAETELYDDDDMDKSLDEGDYEDDDEYGGDDEE